MAGASTVKRVDHRGQAQRRLQLGVDVDARDGQLGVLAVRRRDAQVIQREFERPGLEVDVAHGDLPAQFLARDFLDLAPGDGRHCEPREHPDREQDQQRDDAAPHPFVLFQRSCIHWA